MLEALNDYQYPNSIDAAAALLRKPGSRVIAGGSALTLINNSSIQSLVDIRDLDLAYIRDSHGDFSIGARTTAYEIAYDENLPKSLRSCAFKIGDPPLLHAVTIGGNIADIYPWCDFPCVLLALNATVRFIEIETGKLVTAPASQFFEDFKKRQSTQATGLITEIAIPKPVPHSFDDFQKFTLTDNEKSQANLALQITWEPTSKRVTNARIAVSALTKFPQRVPAVEKILEGSKLNELTISEAARAISNSLEIVPNFKSSVEYRKNIISVFLVRSLRSVIMEAGSK